MTYAVETFELGKRFTVSKGYRDLLPLRNRRQVEVLCDVSLQIPQGEILGLLGPNGAGKTTLLKVLSTLILPSTGWAEVLGRDVVEEPGAVKEVLTYAVSEERSLYWRLTGKQNLRYFASINNIPRGEARRKIDELLSLLDLESAADQRVMYYSTGMKQKLVLARSLLTNPEILLLDEPARSVDPLMARSLWHFIREELVARQGKTVIMATHNLEEARRVCHKIAVLHRGRVRACGTVEELTSGLLGQHCYSLMLHPSANGVHQVLRETPGVLQVQERHLEDDGSVSYDILLEEPEVQVPLILERVMLAKGKILSCTRQEKSLGDLLEVLTGEAPSEPSPSEAGQEKAHD